VCLAGNDFRFVFNTFFVFCFGFRFVCILTMLTVELLRAMMSAQTALPSVIFFHCDCGCDRTGQLAGSYFMRYHNNSWDQVLLFCLVLFIVCFFFFLVFLVFDCFVVCCCCCCFFLFLFFVLLLLYCLLFYVVVL
jgi:hypothetical protein